MLSVRALFESTGCVTAVWIGPTCGLLLSHAQPHLPTSFSEHVTAEACPCSQSAPGANVRWAVPAVESMEALLAFSADTSLVR